MLDQNTDRMWFVIGAVIVGAAIIFIANGTMPDLFASVADTFKDSSDESSAYASGILPMQRGDGVNLLSNPHFDVNGKDNSVHMIHGSRNVRDSIWTGTVTTGTSQWAKRLQKNIILEPGLYTYTIYAKINTNIDNLQIMSFENADIQTNGNYTHEQDGFTVKRHGAYSVPINQGEWETYSISFAVREADEYTMIRYYIPFAEPGSTIQVDWEKLEKGTFATPL